MSDVTSPYYQGFLATLSRLYGTNLADAARTLDIQAYRDEHQPMDVQLLSGERTRLYLVYIGEDKPAYYFEREGEFHPKLYVRWLLASPNPPFTNLFIEDINEEGERAIREKSWGKLSLLEREWIIDLGRRYAAH